MSIARKLAPLAISALVATAIATPSAIAQNTEPLLHNQTPRLIVQQEVHAASDAGCPLVTPSPPPTPSPLVTTGGCRLHIVGDSIEHVRHASAGVETFVSTCDIEVDARIDAAGEGYLTHQELTQGIIGTCIYRAACAQPTPPTGEGRAWSFFMQETEPAPRERITMLICIEIPNMPATATHCEFTIPLTLLPIQHLYRFHAINLQGHGAPNFPRCESQGIFDTELLGGTTGEGQPEQRVEIRHT